MPKLTCACGTTLDLSVIPSPFGAIVIPEPAWEDLTGRVIDALDDEVDRRSFRVEVLGFGNKEIRQAYVCPTCGRLYLFDTPGDSKPSAIWTLESGDARRLVQRPESTDM